MMLRRGFMLAMVLILALMFMVSPVAAQEGGFFGGGDGGLEWSMIRDVLVLVVLVGVLYAVYHSVSPANADKIAGSVDNYLVKEIIRDVFKEVRDLVTSTSGRVTDNLDTRLQSWQPQLTQTMVDDITKSVVIAVLDQLKTDLPDGLGDSAPPVTPMDERPGWN